MKKLILIVITFTAAQAAFGETCKSVVECVSLVSKIKGHKFFYDKSMKSNQVLSNLDINAENADVLLGEILQSTGHGRIKVSENTYKIINARDVRYMATPIVNASYDNDPSFGADVDYYQMIYQLRKGVESREIARNLRPFMSRYGRVINVKSSNTLIVSDTGLNLAKLYQTIKALDVTPTKDQLEENALWEKKDYELKRLRAKNCPDLDSIKDELRNIDFSLNVMKSKT